MSNTGWNLNALVYDLFTGKVDEQLYRDVIAALGDLDGIKLDEFGCGTGNLTSKFPNTAKVRAIDYSPLAIKKAKQKTNENVVFFLMDFYQEQPTEYQPDVIVACRSMFHSDLSKSLEILSNHLGDQGVAVIAHPSKNWREYITPKVNGRRKFDLIQFVKSIGRVANHFNFPYSLFSTEKFEKIGKQYFDEVKITSAGYNTHYLVVLKKEPILNK